MTYKVEWETLEFVGGNSNKFYRAYKIQSPGSAGSWSLVQWGSQKGGVRSGGQAKLAGATQLYFDKLDEKRREGYTQVDTGNVDLDDAVLDNLIRTDDAKGLCAAIESAMRTSASTSAQRAPQNPQAVTCPDCAQIFPTRVALENHRRSVHQIDPATAAPVIAKHPVEALAQRALSALGLASTDPHAAMVEAAKIRVELDKELEVVGRTQSYLQTLDLLVDEEA